MATSLDNRKIIKGKIAFALWPINTPCHGHSVSFIPSYTTRHQPHFSSRVYTPLLTPIAKTMTTYMERRKIKETAIAFKNV